MLSWFYPSTTIVNSKEVISLQPSVKTELKGGSSTGTVVDLVVPMGDSLSTWPNSNNNWPQFLNLQFGSSGTNVIGTVDNRAVGGSTISSMLPQVYARTGAANPIIWIGFNNWGNHQYTGIGEAGSSSGSLGISIFKNLVSSISSMAAFTMFDPPVLNMSSTGVVMTGNWANNNPAFGWDRGISATTGNFTQSVSTRYVYVNLILNSSTPLLYDSTFAYSIDGVLTTGVRLPDSGGGYAGNSYPYDLFFDRGTGNIGVPTDLTIYCIVASGTLSVTRVMGVSTFDVIPNKRALLVGPWQTNWKDGRLGGSQICSAVDLLMRQKVLTWRLRGVDMRYCAPPCVDWSDFVGASPTIHPNERITPLLAKWFGNVLLADVNSPPAGLCMGMSIPDVPFPLL